MLRDWVKYSLMMCRQKADFYSGSRKIIRSDVLAFCDIRTDLTLRHCGYTSAKLTYLRKGYLHKESRDVALALWERRIKQDKYGSVGFTTYSHFVKGGSIDAKRSKRASVMGPCIQAVNLTLLPKRQVAVDVFYRTTEFLKKFPADLVFLRDELLDGFKINYDGLVVNCYFANITVHPMYFITILPSVNDPILEMERIKKADKKFYDWAVKWSARYVCDEYHRGIEKFSQAMRVRKDAYARLDKKTLKQLQTYFRKNHPGYRSGYVDPNELEDEDD